MHRSLTLTLAFLTFLLLTAPALAGPKAPGDLRLGPPAGWKQTKPKASFSHGRHHAAKIECTVCHHTWNGKDRIRSCAAAGCHDRQDRKGAHAFYSAFHDKKTQRSCLGCHKRAKAGPRGCKECHAR